MRILIQSGLVVGSVDTTSPVMTCHLHHATNYRFDYDDDDDARNRLISFLFTAHGCRFYANGVVTLV